ncbi:unnamed protein product [Polarella glacialis]|nr:unnamed protein product [Polarella glacialis]
MAVDSAISELRLLHANVFEDGLADTPGNLGFTADFRRRASELLRVLCDDGQGRLLYGFTPSRDLSRLPPTVPLASVESIFGFIDVLYSAFYHPLGGEARLGLVAPGEPPNLESTLRGLFLRSTLADPSAPPSPTNPWQSFPGFEAALQDAFSSSSGGLSAEREAELRRRLRGIANDAFEPAQGSLSWERSTIEGIFKRHENVMRDKWDRYIAMFQSAADDSVRNEGATATALSLLLHVKPSTGARSQGEEMMALLETFVDGQSGRVERVRTLSMRAAVWWLLLRLCQHSLRNPHAASAIEAFSGGATVSSDAEGRAATVFRQVLQAIDLWEAQSDLAYRHARLCDTFRNFSPAVATLVEYDAQWRKLPLPAVRSYEVVSGSGNASILFDGHVFERLLAVAEQDIPSQVEGERAPKSSAVVLLRHRSSGVLCLVMAVHLESGPPSKTSAVRLRSAQTQALLASVAKLAALLRSQGERCAVFVGGDFNAVREEFISGNTPDFYETPDAVQPEAGYRAPPCGPSSEPSPSSRRAFQSSLGPCGELCLSCDGVDEGWLREVSRAGAPAGSSLCSRAGAPVVIDFILAASLGYASECDPFKAESVAIATLEEQKEAADKDGGLAAAVRLFGSDHLPVACAARL